MGSRLGSLGLRLRLGLPWLGVLLAACGSEDLGSFDRVVVQRDLLTDLGQWSVIREGQPDSIEFGVLTPSYSAAVDGGDLPSILVPPGSAVSYSIPAGDGPATLRCAAGVDLSVPRSLPVGGGPLQVQFRAKLDGKLVLNQVVRVQPIAPNARNPRSPQVWHWIGAKGAGLPVRGGQTLTLSTKLYGDSTAPAEGLKVGFGGLVTESKVSTPRTKASHEQPNIVLVVMDTERADRTSTHGYEKATTPNLDRLAARGLRFDDAWVTAPWTWPATASIMTGLEPLSHGVTSHESCYLSHQLPSLPKLLQSRGFTSAGFSCNPLIDADKNFDGGFERFESTEDFTPGKVVMPEVLEWVRQNAERRFFLYLHLVDPHDPHRPSAAQLARLGGAKPRDFPDEGYRKLGGRLRKKVVELGEGGFDHQDFVSPLEEQWIREAYDACVATGDEHLGQLLDLLEALQLDETTVVAFTSDHGEELFDHGLTNHAHSLHPELMKVPLVIAGPGVPRGELRELRTSNRHLATTLAQLGGGDLGVTDGLNLIDGDFGGEDQLFFHTTKGIWNDWSMVEIFGLLDADWSLHWAPEGRPFRTLPEVDPGLGQWRLYDRRNDPRELKDVSDEHPDRVAKMRDAIQRWRDLPRERRTQFGPGAATTELLQGVGYIQLDDE